ncbi:MAG TPA: lipoyl(octanoyl) transferase LipB [Candidatus Omnitrophota bacterium]|nr:lipoyl(octanoyl) transferase LipB [Candidatus Omnitrophota bacterium]
MQCHIIDLGLIDFLSAYHIQQQTVRKVLDERIPTVILCEHRPVFTLGRLAREGGSLLDPGSIRQQGIDILRTDRGGDVTFHGPGQLIAYPIFFLKEPLRDLKRFLYKLEDVVIDLLKYFGIVANRLNGYTGVFVREKKIASIGIGVKKWVTYHGIGLNVSTDLSPFSLVKPCGLDVTMTSIARELKADASMDLVKQEILDQLAKKFDLKMMDICHDKRN